MRDLLERRIDDLERHIDALFVELEKRYDERHKAQEEALKVALAREQNYLSKSMGYVLIGVSIFASFVGLAAIFYRGVA